MEYNKNESICTVTYTGFQILFCDRQKGTGDPASDSEGRPGHPGVFSLWREI